MKHLSFNIDRPKLASALQVSLVSEQPEESLPAPPPKPEFLPPPPVMIEMPDLQFQDLPAPERTITVALAPQIPVQSFQPKQEPAPVAAPKLVSAVEYLKPLKPNYPSMSRRLREEGLVVLRVLVDREGRASQIELHRSSGHDRLDRAAREAVACAKFKPYVEAGVVQPALVLIPIEFTLNQRVARR